MARKTKEDAQKTRDQILRAAESVFYAKGFTLTTISDVAEAATLSRGAVYGHYKSKLEIATAMAQRVIDQVLPFQGNASLSPLLNLKQYCLQEIRSYIEPGALQKVISFLYVGIDDSPELLQLRYAWEKKRITQIEILLRQAIAEGELKQDVDFELVSLYCQAIIEGVFSIVHFGNLQQDQCWKKAEQLCEFGLQRLSA